MSAGGGSVLAISARVRAWAAAAWDWEGEHPYLFSTLLSWPIVAWAVFYAAGGAAVDQLQQPEAISFVNIKELSAPKRVVKRQISTAEGAPSPDAPADKASGSADADPVDLAFFPDVVPPKLVGKISQIYPQQARDLGVEAKLEAELTISKDGVVLDTKINYIELSKKLPAALDADLKKKFAVAARLSLNGARFSKPIVNGKNLPVIRQFPFAYTLKGG